MSCASHVLGERIPYDARIESAWKHRLPKVHGTPNNRTSQLGWCIYVFVTMIICPRTLFQLMIASLFDMIVRPMYIYLVLCVYT